MTKNVGEDPCVGGQHCCCCGPGQPCCDCGEIMPRMRAWPAALTPELRALLGQMCFVLGPVAHVYQAIGEYHDSDGAPLGKRAEDEQAFMLHKMLGYWFVDPKTWSKAAIADLNRARALLPTGHRHANGAA